MIRLAGEEGLLDEVPWTTFLDKKLSTGARTRTLMTCNTLKINNNKFLCSTGEHTKTGSSPVRSAIFLHKQLILMGISLGGCFVPENYPQNTFGPNFISPFKT
jgi:hypothetical protein